jgi:hypothetical protein
MKNSTKAQKTLEYAGVEKNMRIVFSNLDALQNLKNGASLERRIRKVRDRWKIDGKFAPWMMEVVDACYEAVLRGRGYGGVNEVKKKKWR